MTNGNRRANAAAEAALGDDALEAAEALLGIDLPNDAVSRGYYAAFHYARGGRQGPRAYAGSTRATTKPASRIMARSASCPWPGVVR